MLTGDAGDDQHQDLFMSAPFDMLWWLSHEYGQRLAKASSYLELLEQLLVERSGAETKEYLIDRLREARDYLNALQNEFHDWRYSFLYETPESKRMVHADRAVQQALGSFRRMYARHVEELIALGSYFYQLPRPATRVTLVPTGDLWDLLSGALAALIDFDQDRMAET